MRRDLATGDAQIGAAAADKKALGAVLARVPAGLAEAALDSEKQGERFFITLVHSDLNGFTDRIHSEERAVQDAHLKAMFAFIENRIPAGAEASDAHRAHRKAFRLKQN